jgi:hypothetical protein
MPTAMAADDMPRRGRKPDPVVQARRQDDAERLWDYMIDHGNRFKSKEAMADLGLTYYDLRWALAICRDDARELEAEILPPGEDDELYFHLTGDWVYDEDDEASHDPMPGIRQLTKHSVSRAHTLDTIIGTLGTHLDRRTAAGRLQADAAVQQAAATASLERLMDLITV